MSETPPYDQNKSDQDEAVDQALDLLTDDKMLTAGAKAAERLNEGHVPARIEASKEPNYTARRIVTGLAVAAGAAGATFGISEAAEKNREEHPVTETVITIPEGGAIITEAQKALNDLVDLGLDENAIGNDEIVHAGQMAAGEGPTMPGDQFNLEITKNGFGNHSVDISPLNDQDS